MDERAARADIEARTMGKVTRRLLPFLMVCYFIAYLDRVNVGFAGATMRADLGLSATAFGGAAGIFFVAYFLFEVPSNLALDRFGARVWITRIMFTWGLVSGAQAFVGGETSFNVVRLLLGFAEAGFFPGIIFFLTLWFPSAYRGRIVGMFMMAIPISTVVGAPLSGLILYMDGLAGLHGWQWIFIIEALPALLMAVAVYVYLTDRPRDAAWLTAEESGWLQARLDAERAHRESRHRISWRRAIVDPRVIAFGLVYMGENIPQYGLSFFLPQIVKGFGGLSSFEVGLVTAIPYAVGAIGMVLWGRSSDRTGERKWHTMIPLLCITVGLLAASAVGDPTAKMACICVAGFGFFGLYAAFWALPTAILSGTSAAAGIAAINSIGNLGGYFGPQVFGMLKDSTGGETAGMIFFAACALVAAGIVFVVGHDRTLERAPTEEPIAQATRI